MAIFLDVENLFGGYHRDVTGVRLGKVVRGIERVVRASGIGGRTAVARAYANWARPEMAGYKRELQEHGIKPVQVFSFEKSVKNAADIELCVEVLEVAQDAPWVEVFVIVTGDGGFVPLIRRLHALNKYVVVVSTTAPNAGIVNPLLKAVADEYHQIDVKEALPVQGQAVAAPPVARVAAPVVAPVVSPDGSTAAAPAGQPELADVRKAVLDFIKGEPQLLVKGQVDTAALGQRMGKRWQGLKYANYGSKNLGGFVEKHCGLVARVTPSQKAKAAPKKSTVQPVRGVVCQASSREEYLASVRGLFNDGSLGLLVREAGPAGIGLGAVAAHLSAGIHGFGRAESGFPKVHQALQHALAGTEYHVVRTSDTAMAVVHNCHVDHADVLAPVTAQGLKDPDLVRGVLGMREPPVRYPEAFTLSDVVRVVLEPVEPQSLPGCMARIAAELPHLREETVHQTVMLLVAVGVLIQEAGTGRVLVASQVATETQALELVIDDALRRAAEVRWPVDAGDLVLALY